MTPETAPESPQAQREAPGHGSVLPDPPQASHGAREAKRAASEAWGMLMGIADEMVEEQLEREAKAKLCPNCGRKATPRGGWCVTCADERRRKYNTAWVRSSRNAQPREDRLEQRIVQYFEAMGWETAEWRRQGPEKNRAIRADFS